MKLTVNVVCSECDRLFERDVDAEDLSRDYTRQSDGAYVYDRGEDWCDQCEEEDMRTITRDYYPPNFRGHRI